MHSRRSVHPRAGVPSSRNPLAPARSAKVERVHLQISAAHEHQHLSQAAPAAAMPASRLDTIEGSGVANLHQGPTSGASDLASARDGLAPVRPGLAHGLDIGPLRVGSCRTPRAPEPRQLRSWAPGSSAASGRHPDARGRPHRPQRGRPPRARRRRSRRAATSDKAIEAVSVGTVPGRFRRRR